MRGMIIAGAALMLGGCATVVEGTSQSVAITTQPPGASCSVSRMGQDVGAVQSTPGSVHVDKSKNDLSVTCAKEGYQTTTVTYSPEFNGATFGNIILGGGIGAVVDASTGANYNYPKEVSLALPEASAAQSTPAVAAAPAGHAVAAAPAAAPASATTPDTAGVRTLKPGAN
jgi:hypothetical protein